MADSSTPLRLVTIRGLVRDEVDARVFDGARIPVSYAPASWRNVTPVCPKSGRIGLGFDLPDGTVVRVQIALDDMRAICEVAQDYMKLAAGSQSPMSDEMPSSSRSAPSSGVEV